MSLSRRNFLKIGLSSMAYYSAAGTVPLWISKSAQALAKSLAGDRILVIVQMAGGNDGLNTVIPYTDPYYLGNTLRPTLHITSGYDQTVLDGMNAFHPKLIRLKDWWVDGKLAVVQNVGYPNPNLSHFVAMDYWEHGNSPGSATGADLNDRRGWIARFFDNQCAGVPTDTIDPLTMLATGHYLVPVTLGGSTVYTPPAIGDFDFYEIPYPEDANQPVITQYGHLLRDYVDQLGNVPVINTELDFLQRSFNLAQASIDDVNVAKQIETVNPYPRGQLGDGLDMASRIIRAGFGTKIFYVSQVGYDTHANQIANGDPINGGDHPRLLDEFDQALHAFLADMATSGNLDRVLLMTFSEFGRRAQENGSSGTDHGAANCLFLMGGKVNQGVYGGQPSLSPDGLLNGSLRHTLDFRSVYSVVLRDWFGADPLPVFGAEDFAQYQLAEGMDQLPVIAKESEAKPEDVNQSGTVDAVDVQLTIIDALGGDSGYDTDINEDGTTDAIDVQMVINAVLTGNKNLGPPMPKSARASVGKPRGAGQ